MATVTVLPLALERGEYCQTHVHSVLAAEAKLVRNSFVGFFCIVGLVSWAVDVLVMLPSRFGVRQVYDGEDDGDAQNTLCASGSISVCDGHCVFGLF